MSLAYLFAAYLAIWIGLWIYTLGLGLRQRNMQREIETLKRWVADASPEGPGQEAVRGRS